MIGRRSAGVLTAAALCSALLTGASPAIAVTHAVAAGRGDTLADNWGKAEEVPGTAALNLGGAAGVNSVSCTSPGTCSAGGNYADASHDLQAFVTDETNGTWGTAEEVPGTAALNQGGEAGVNSVSCSSAGTCSAGGLYRGAHHSQAFVVSETNGTWGTAEKVPGTAALNKKGAAVNSVSCSSAGNCSAAGLYTDSSHHDQAFVADETNGTWGTAEEVPGIAALNKGSASINSVSCPSAGNCAVGGFYTGSSGHTQPFVADETNGTWGTAEEVPGTAALDKQGGAVGPVSCGSAGNCSAGGSFIDGSGDPQVWVAGETNGTWGKAKEVPGTAALNKGGDALMFSVSCGSAGNCSAGGSYTAGSGAQQAFVAVETNGTWGKAKEVPGTGALNKGGMAGIGSLSCASPGNCAAAGFYTDKSDSAQVFVTDETNGTWGTAQEIPGSAALNKGGFAQITSVSCGSAGNCSAGGFYVDVRHQEQAFVVSEG
jgi:cytochrome c551/c552